MSARRPLPFALLLGLAVACRGGDPKPEPDGGADGADGGDGGADGGDGGGPDTGDTGAPAPSADPVEELLAALDAASEAPVQVQTERGRITWIDVDLPLPAGDDPFAAARAAIAPWAEIWHVRDRELVPARKVEDPSIGTAGVWFAVHVGGVPIYGAEVGVFAQDGRVLQLVGNLPRAPVAPRAPTLSAALAARALVSDGWITLSDGTLAYHDPSLFGGPEGGPRLAGRSARGPRSAAAASPSSTPTPASSWASRPRSATGR